MSWGGAGPPSLAGQARRQPERTLDDAAAASTSGKAHSAISVARRPLSLSVQAHAWSRNISRLEEKLLQHLLPQSSDAGGAPASYAATAAPLFVQLVQQCNMAAVQLMAAGMDADLQVAHKLLARASALLQRHSSLVPLQQQMGLKSATLSNSGCLHKRQGRLHLALKCFQRTLALEQRMCSSTAAGIGTANGVDATQAAAAGTAGTLLNMCAVLSAMGLHEAALEHAQLAVQRLLQTPRHPEQHSSQPEAVDTEENHQPGAAAAPAAAADADADAAQATSASSQHTAAETGPPADANLLASACHNMAVELEFLGRPAQALNAYRMAADAANGASSRTQRQLQQDLAAFEDKVQVLSDRIGRNAVEPRAARTTSSLPGLSAQASHAHRGGKWTKGSSSADSSLPSPQSSRLPTIAAISGQLAGLCTETSSTSSRARIRRHHGRTTSPYSTSPCGLKGLGISSTSSIGGSWLPQLHQGGPSQTQLLSTMPSRLQHRLAAEQPDFDLSPITHLPNSVDSIGWRDHADGATVATARRALGGRQRAAPQYVSGPLAEAMLARARQLEAWKQEGDPIA